MLPGRRITPASADAVVWCRSCISKAFFFWANPIITTAYNRGKREAGGLLESDLFDLRTGFTAEEVANESRELWTQQARRCPPPPLPERLVVVRR